MAKPPQFDLELSNLPTDPQQRHEVLVGVFGKCMVWLRNWAVDESREVVESQELRDKLGSIRKRKYDAIAELNPEQRLAACKFAEAAIDRVIQLFLTMLSGTGVDQQFNKDHAIRFKLIMEILAVETADTVLQETINRSGEKFFADYWRRWLNRSEE